MILMISDPQNPQHDDRADLAHYCNASWDKREGKKLLKYIYLSIRD